MRREYSATLIVGGILTLAFLALQVVNQRQVSVELQELRTELSRLRGQPIDPVAPAVPLPPEPAETQPEVPAPSDEELATFSRIFRQNLEEKLVSDSQTEETRTMIREALETPRETMPR